MCLPLQLPFSVVKTSSCAEIRTEHVFHYATGVMVTDIAQMVMMSLNAVSDGISVWTDSQWLTLADLICLGYVMLNVTKIAF